jgi:nitronate monooxygenase
VAIPNHIKNNLSIPVIGSPLFLVSGPELVIAQCKAGIIGSFPALNAIGDNNESKLDDWLYEINEKLYGCNNNIPSFAVNQIVHSSNNRLMSDMDVIVKHKVPIVITSLGAKKEINDAVHSYGGIVLHDVTTNEFAKKAISKGADGLIAVASGAGGHAGTQSPFALVQEIRDWFDGPLILSGAISTGKSIAAAITMGADYAYIGSPFIATTEANASIDYKNMIVKSNANDIVNTDFFTGIPGNYLKESVFTISFAFDFTIIFL